MRSLLSLSCGALALSLLLPVAGRAQGGEPRFIVTGKDAILLSPPVVAIPGQADYAEWSPDGKYVLGARQAIRFPANLEKIPDPRELLTEQALVLWSAETRKSTELWSQNTGIGPSPQTAWLGGTNVAYALISQERARPAAAPQPMEQPTPERWLCLIDARKPSLRALFRVGAEAQLTASPVSPVAALFLREERLVQIFGTDGRARHAVSFPQNVQPLSLEWTADGRNLLVFTVRTEPGKGDGAQAVAHLLLDTATGKLAAAEGPPPAFRATAPALPIRLVRQPGRLMLENTRQDTSSLWLAATDSSEKQAALVTPHAAWAKLSPRGDAILYQAEGSAFVTPLVRVSRELYVKARQEALKAQLMSNAKQIGLALHLYASDHDNRLPSADEPVPGLLLNYTRSQALMEGFVYTHTGGPLADVKEPHNTVLGYIEAPGGGRIQLYVDGHVMFKKDE